MVMVTPVLGTPTSGVLTNCTGTASGLTAGNVTTNANLTGHITSTGNAAILGAFTVAQLNTALSDGAIFGKQTIYVPRAAMIPATTSGAAPGQIETTAGQPDIFTLDFDASADEYAQFNIAFPKQWNEGTITFRAFWASTAADTDGVSWALQGVAVADNGSIDVAYGTAIVVDDANQGAAEELLITAESGAVTIAGTPGEDEQVFFQVFRDVSDSNDTATEDAGLLGVQLFWTNNAATDD